MCVLCVCVHVCLSIIKRVVGSVVHVIVLSHHVVERRLIVKLFNVVGCLCAEIFGVTNWLCDPTHPLLSCFIASGAATEVLPWPARG